MTTIIILLLLIFLGFKLLKHIDAGGKNSLSTRRHTKQQQNEYKRLLTFEELIEDEEKDEGGKNEKM